MQPLSGLLVADCSDGIAGGYAAKLLHDAGATVTKVEGPAGDSIRRRGEGFLAYEGPHALFRHLHEGHEPLRIDPASESGRAGLRRLLTSVDVLIEGSDSTWVLPEVGADLLGESRTGRSDMVVVTISPFGTAGPWSAAPANEFTLSALSGRMAFRAGLGNRPPLAPGGSPGLWLAGAYAALSAVGYDRLAKKGIGTKVDVSILEAMVLAYGREPMEEQLRGRKPSRWAVNPQAEAPPNVHATADGHVVFGVVTAQQWSDFATMIGRPEWSDDKVWASAATRYDRREELLAVIQPWMAARTSGEVAELASLFRVPAGQVASGETVTSLDCFGGWFSDVPTGFIRPGSPLRLSPLGGTGTPRRAESGTGLRRGLEEDPAAGSGRPLAGLRIADFTAFWAGPHAGGLLALLGAEVVHVESPGRPDGMRMTSAKPDRPDWLEFGSVFHLNNGSKKGVTIDMATPEGLEAARAVITRSDGVIENFSPRVMDSFGLDRPHLGGLRPELVYVRMPAFGLDNPWRDRVGFQMSIEAVASLAYVTGYPDGTPLSIGVSDVLAGVHAAFAMGCGLRHAERTGQGVHAEVRLSEVAAAAAAESVVTASAYGVVLARVGNRQWWGGPQGAYPCLPDGEEPCWVALSVDTDEQWGALRRVLGEPPGTTIGTMESGRGRVEHGDHLDGWVAHWCSSRRADDIVRVMWEVGVPTARIGSGLDVLELPQLVARGFCAQLVHPACGPLFYPGLPMVVTRLDTDSRLPTQHVSPAPTLGQDNGFLSELIEPRAEGCSSCGTSAAN